jgi:hypothetical protein
MNPKASERTGIRQEHHVPSSRARSILCHDTGRRHLRYEGRAEDGCFRASDRPRGRVIPGLYGVGNCVSSASAEAYWGAGGTLGPIITYGWLAGRHISKG